MALYYINGTSNSGSTFGQSGNYYPLYLTSAEAVTADISSGGTGTAHTHVFTNSPLITFYMPTTGAMHAQALPPTGSLHGEYYISYTSPIAQVDTMEIGTGVLAGDTFDTWRKKTNDIGREIIANKAMTNALNTDFSSLITTTGGETNIALKSGNQTIAGDNTFSHVVRFTGADDSSNAIRVGDSGRLYQATGSGFIFNDTVDNSAASGAVKTSSLEVTSGIAKYGGIQYTWPTGAPTTGQILKAGLNNTLDWDDEASASTNIDAFIVEQLDKVGSIKQFAGSSLTPESDGSFKYLFCDGAAVNYADYAELFGVIGKTYNLSTDTGADFTGTTPVKFRLPNLKGRVAVGNSDGSITDASGTAGTFTLGSSVATIDGVGSIGGNFDVDLSHTLSVEEMPPHKHWMPISGSGGGGNIYGVAYGGSADGGAGIANQNNHQRGTYYAGGTSNDNGAAGGNSTQSNTPGTNNPFTFNVNTIQPFLVLNYIIRVKPDNIAQLHFATDSGILLSSDGGSTYSSNAASNLLSITATNSNPNKIKLDIDTNDFEFNGNQLKLVDTNYRSGEVVETFSGPCGIFTNSSGTTPSDADTHTRTVLSGTYRMPSCGNSTSGDMAPRIVTNVGEIFGGVSYKRIAGVKYIYYAFAYNAKPYDNHGIWSHTPVVDSRAVSSHVADNTDISGTGGGNSAVRAFTSGVHVFQNQQNNFDVITPSHDTKLFINEFTVECVDTLEEQNIALSKVYWPVGSTYQLSSMIRNEHDTDHEVGIFMSHHNRHGTNTTRFNSPHLTITATAG